MDPVFEVQYRMMKAELAGRGVDVEIAYTPRGEVDYLYHVDHILVLDREDNLNRVASHLGDGVERVDPEATRVENGLAELALRGRFSVPEALQLIDSREEERVSRSAAPVTALVAAPDHVVSLARLCPAGEPEVPPGAPTRPWPPVRAGTDGRGVTIGVSDTGLLDDIGGFPWLAGVTGDVDPLPAPDASGVVWIPDKYTGHGTFIAGAARSVAPGAAVVVNNHMTSGGGELETVFCRKLRELLAGEPRPQVLSLSAGTYTRLDRGMLGFVDLFDQVLSTMPDVVLVAAAGNDNVDREFWPAAFDWAVGVGALGPDMRHRAWFSNFGPWVDVYTLGEGMIDAYATGTYTYREPPKAPAKQDFAGMARWDGTSFATPLVAGLIAGRIARTGEQATVARDAVLAAAGLQPIPGLGPMLSWSDTP
jgi:subtilisin family serine protease